jgi:hypothetical protein
MKLRIIIIIINIKTEVYIYIYTYIKSMGCRPAPHTQAKWPFGHLKQDGQMANKRNKKKNK